MTPLFLGLLSAFLHSAIAIPTYSTNNTYVHPKNGICTDYTVKETITWSKAIWALPKPKDNFDIAALRTSIGELNSDFHPFSRSENITSTYELSGTFCTPMTKKGDKHNTVLLATHGGGYDGR
jgi:hypothetical protein